MKIRDRLHRSFTLVVLSVLCVTGVIILVLTRSTASAKLEKELSQTSFLIYKIVQNVYDLNEKMLLGNLKLLESAIETVDIDYSREIDSDAEHYITRLTDYVQVPVFYINGKRAFGNTEFVDRVASISGGNISVLQLFPQGLLQIATNIRRPDGTRATQIYYPNGDKITDAIRAGRTYVGKAFEMSEWHIVAYKPIFYHGVPIGAIHAGIKPDIDDLRKHILDIRIGRTGTPYIVDTEGILIIAAEHENENVYHLPHIKRMIEDRKDGTVVYREDGQWPTRKEEIVVHYRYLPEMEWIIAAGSYKREFFSDQEIITWIIVLSMFVAFGAAVIVSYRVSDNLTRPIQFLTDSMNAVTDLKFDFSDFPAVERIKNQLKGSTADGEEIVVLTAAYYRMLNELEEAQRQLISKHRRFREIELSKKVGAMLSADFEMMQNYDGSARGAASDEVAGYYFDRSSGPEGQNWYLLGKARERSSAAGLIMMMAQSAVGSIARSIPDATSVEIVQMLNDFLVGSLRARADLDDLLSLSLVVTHPDGFFEYTGLEDRLMIFSRTDGRCREVLTELREWRTGVDAGSVVRYERAFMAPGDILICGSVDYGRSGDPSGHERIARLVEAHPDEGVEELATRIHAAPTGDKGTTRVSGSVILIARH